MASWLKCRKSAIALIALYSVNPVPVFADNASTWGTISDIGMFSLDAVAIGVPIAKGDKQGAFQAGGSIAAATLVSTGLKHTFPEWRPDRSDRRSFPSGHTSNAFAAATSLLEREGADVGIPALAVASVVGFARVKANKHHWYDVVAGAGIGTISGLVITHRPKGDRITNVIPWVDSDGAGLNVAMRF
jgi:membrane-associated phospholipid phosphatase